ncbi:MAG: carbohydrate ABC transporter permease [Actinomycetales bacterium]|nr:carbohydrate ABC transporter permease [Actinomycetales bacterium]
MNLTKTSRRGRASREAAAEPRRNPRNERPNQRPPWEEPPTVAGNVAKGATILAVLAVILLPIYSVIMTSFSTKASVDAAGGLVVVPEGGVTLNAYREIIQGGVVTRALVVSLGVTVVGTAVSMVVTVLCAYGLSRPRSFAHRTILFTLILTMFFSGGIIPSFLVVAALGGYEQYWSLILPSAVSVFNILVMRAFFANTAPELIDSGRIDGASEWRILWSIVLPTSKAVNAVIALFYAVGYWNSFFNVLLYMPAANEKWPLQLVLYNYVTQGFTMAGTGRTELGGYLGRQQVAHLSLQMAVVVLTLVPIMLVYPFVQRHFTKGMLIGAVKG